jgi:hypothetical protein
MTKNIRHTLRSVKLIFFLILFLFLLSCKKDQSNTTIIKGNISHLTSPNVFSGVILKLVLNNSEERFGRISYQPYNPVFITDSIEINEKGEFNQNYENLDKNGDYCVLVYNDTIYSDIYKIQVGETNEFQILVNELGYLVVNISRNNNYQAIIGQVDNYLIHSGYLLENDIVDTSMIFRLIPGVCDFANYYYKEISPDTIINETITISPTDTITKLIEY